MHRLTYWYARCLHDTNAYSIRRKTRKEVLVAIADTGVTDGFGMPVKVTVEYQDPLDLVNQCLGEGSLGESGVGEESDTPAPGWWTTFPIKPTGGLPAE